MTTFTIKVQKPTNGFKNLHGAIKAVPFGLLSTTDAIPAGDEFVITLTGKKKEDTYTAATSFMSAFDGDIISAIEKTGKGETNFFETLE